MSQAEIISKIQEYTLAPSEYDKFNAVHFKIYTVKFLGHQYIANVNEKTKNWYYVSRNRYSRRGGYHAGLRVVEVNGRKLLALVTSVRGDGYTVHFSFPSWYEIPFLMKYYKEEIEKYFSKEEIKV